MGDRVYLDVDGIADYLGTTVRHIRHLVATRRIPHTKVGGRLRFDRRRIDEWMRAHSIEVAS
jgi:excisionase family DNA binding protein